MSEFVVYIDQNDVELKIDHNVLRINALGSQLKQLPLKMIGQIVIYGKINLSSNLIAELVKRQVSVVFFSGFGTERFPVWAGPGLSSSVFSRVSQFNSFSNTTKKLKTAAWLINSKIKNQLSLLESISQLSENEKTDHIFKKSMRKSQLSKHIQKTVTIMHNTQEAIATCDSVDSMRGHEGTAASAWFNFLSKTLKKEWKFKGRNRRPPKDPINALLSLTYMLTMAEMKVVVNERGLDPCVGFLHALHSGRESFVIDMLEPLRPGADAFVISLLDEQLFNENDFTMSKEYGCRLNKDGRGKYFLAWANWRTQWPEWNTNPTETKESKEYEIEINEKNLRTCSRNLIDQVVALWDD